MNKNLFRIIFNKRRGQLMAVAETSSSQGKGFRGESVTSGHSTTADYATVAISALSFAVLCALPMHLTLVRSRHAKNSQDRIESAHALRLDGDRIRFLPHANQHVDGHWRNFVSTWLTPLRHTTVTLQRLKT